MATRPGSSNQTLPLRAGPPQVQRPTPTTADPRNTNQGKPNGAPPAKPARKYEWPSNIPNDIRSAMHATIELAVKLLKTPPSRRYLLSLGLEVITSFGPGQHKCPSDTDERKMQGLLTFFLDSLDSEFLKIEYSRRQGAAALLTTANWYTATTKTLRDWRPHAGGTLSFGESVFRPLAASRAARQKADDPQQRALHDEAGTRLLFAAGAAVAAHLATCFVAFLAGGPAASAKFARGDRAADQSVWAYKWERAVLGGELTTREEKRMHPLRAGQGGTVWLLDEKKFATRVDEECVRAVAACGKAPPSLVCSSLVGWLGCEEL